jgi:hypothetical protein
MTTDRIVYVETEDEMTHVVHVSENVHRLHPNSIVYSNDIKRMVEDVIDLIEA